MSLHIGVDVDGVLALHMPAMLDAVREVAGVELRLEQVKDYFFAGLVPRELMEAVFVRCLETCYDLPAFPDIHLVNQLPGRVTIVTHRPEELAGEATRAWLGLHGIRHERLIFATGAKSDFGPFDVFIDDAPHNAVELATHGARVYLMDHPYNREYDYGAVADRIIRVAGWGEIDGHVQALGAARLAS